MKKIVYLLAASALLLLSSCSDRIIPVGQLPEAAKTFLEQYFPGIGISYIKKDAELLKTTYEVRLDSGAEIDFDSKGEWDKVDCKRQSVPSDLVPAAINTYVEGTFPGQFVVKIDKEIFGYEVELSNDLDLKFTKDGRLVGVDD
jgi:hypothetical protein